MSKNQAQNIPPDILKKYEEHKRLAQTPMAFGSWLELMKENKVISAKAIIKLQINGLSDNQLKFKQKMKEEKLNKQREQLKKDFLNGEAIAFGEDTSGVQVIATEFETKEAFCEAWNEKFNEDINNIDEEDLKTINVFYSLLENTYYSNEIKVEDENHIFIATLYGFDY